MQNLPTPIKETEASMPTKNVRKGPSQNQYTNGTFKVPRKAAKRTLPFDLTAGELHLVKKLRLDEDIRARKKPRLEEPFSAATDENATKISSLNTPVRLPPLGGGGGAAAANHADSGDLVMDMHLNASTTRAPRRWTTDEDTRLKKAVLVQNHDGETQNWDVIASLVPGRTKTQCKSRWYGALDPRNVRTTTRMDKWTPDEDNKLKDAVQMHNGKNWFAITALVLGRTKKQCYARWYGALDPRNVRTTTHMDKWTPDEDDKLKDAVKMHNGKNWFEIATLVLGRTRTQCHHRWREAFDPRVDGRLRVRVNGH
jgi:hypothetical protein